MIELPTGHIQKGKGRNSTMRRVVALLLSVLLASSLTSATTTGGVDKDPVLEDTVFTSITHTANAHDGGTWSIDFALNSNATDNGTTFTLTTQQCTNDGVCDPPESRELVYGEEAGTFSSSVVTKDVPKNSVYAGNPAKLVKELDEGEFVSRESFFSDPKKLADDFDMLDRYTLAKNSTFSWIKSLIFRDKSH